MKKTYYVISHSHKWYLDDRDFGTTGLGGAKRYKTLADAMVAAVEKKSWLFERDGSREAHGSKWAIIRVEETPGATKRVISKRTHLDATKPCVVSYSYGSYPHLARNADLMSWTDSVEDLDDAHVFPALDDALLAINQRAAFGPNALLKIHNVREEPVDTQITLTVVE